MNEDTAVQQSTNNRQIQLLIGNINYSKHIYQQLYFTTRHEKYQAYFCKILKYPQIFDIWIKKNFSKALIQAIFLSNFQ